MLRCTFFFLTTSLCIQTTMVLYGVASSQCSQPLPIATFAQCVLTLTPKGKKPDGPAYLLALGFVSLRRDSTPNPTLCGWKRDEYSPANKSQRLRKNSVLYHNLWSSHELALPTSPTSFHDEILKLQQGVFPPKGYCMWCFHCLYHGLECEPMRQGPCLSCSPNDHSCLPQCPGQWQLKKYLSSECWMNDWNIVESIKAYLNSRGCGWEDRITDVQLIAQAYLLPCFLLLMFFTPIYYQSTFCSQFKSAFPTSSEYLQLDIPQWCRTDIYLSKLHLFPYSFFLMASPT